MRRLPGLTVLSAAVLLSSAASGCAAPEPAGSDQPDVEYLMANPASGLPFSDAVRLGELLILSGQIGTDSTNQLVPGGMVAEARQTLENVRGVLERNGAGLRDVVKCTVMLADISEWAAFNEVYRTYFTERLPARSAFGANGLALGARVELECWAAVPDRD